MCIFPAKHGCRPAHFYLRNFCWHVYDAYQWRITVWLYWGQIRTQTCATSFNFIYVYRNNKYMGYLLPTFVSVGFTAHQRHRFNDSHIPAHVTWAHIHDARIVRNDEFYEMPRGANKTIDLLLLMANAPVPTLLLRLLPGSGSEAYTGPANAMKLATEELVIRFPGFFGESTHHCKG